MLCLGLGLSVQRNWAVMAFLGSSTTIITSSKSLLTSKAYHLIYSGLDDGQEDERRNQDKHLADLSYITGQESQSSFHQKWLDHVASRKCVSSIDISRDYKIEYGLAAVGDEVYEYTAEGTTGKLLSEEYFGTKETLIGQKIVSVLPQHRRLNPLYPGKEPKAVPPHSQYPVYKCALCERKRNANFDGTVLLGDTEGKWGYFFDPHLQTQGFATLIPFDSIKKQALSPAAATALVALARGEGRAAAAAGGTGREGWVATYSSLGAGARTEHLHLEAWAPPRALAGVGLPVARWADHPTYAWEGPGGVRAAVKYSYSAFCATLRGGGAADMAEALHCLSAACDALDIPHNLVAHGDEVYVFLRKPRPQATEVVDLYAPGVTLGAAHLAGVWPLVNLEQHKKLTAVRAHCALRSTRLSWYAGLLLLDRVFGGSVALEEKWRKEEEAAAAAAVVAQGNGHE